MRFVLRAFLALALVTAVAVAFAGLAEPAAPAPVRASYIYSYMTADHLDSLASHGFTRVLAHTIAESLDTRTRSEFRTLAARARADSLEFVPEWLFQSASRLAARPAERRYTWGPQATVEVAVACPLDSVYWQRAVFDRAEELLALLPQTTRLALDLELYHAGRHHYDGGDACHCAWCVREYTAGVPALAGKPPSALSGLGGWEEERLTQILTPLLASFAQRHPGVRLEVFDLDLDSFVHRALCHALAQAQVPTTDYTERTYATGAADVPAARARLERLGLASTPIAAGLWLRRWPPAALPVAMRAIGGRGDGIFVFTTYSLWADSTKLVGAYALQGTPSEYWTALSRGNAQ